MRELLRAVREILLHGTAGLLQHCNKVFEAIVKELWYTDRCEKQSISSKSMQPFRRIFFEA